KKSIYLYYKSLRHKPQNKIAIRHKNNLKFYKMRNLILLAATFAIALSETDVEQLGYDVTKEDFLSYFGIDESTHVNNENFSPMDNSVYMTAEEEKAVHDKIMVKKAKAKGITKKDDQAKADKADEKAAGAS